MVDPEKFEYTSKRLEKFLVFDFHTNKCRLCEKRYGKLKGTEIVVKLNINLNIPIRQDLVFDADITLRKEHLDRITAELI